MKKLLVMLGSTLVFTTMINAQTAATVNGMEISVEEANKVLYTLTRSNEKTWDKLTKEEKDQLIRMMAPAKVIAARSKKELSTDEKEVALANFYMQKKISQTEVSDEEAEAAYNKMIELAQKEKSDKKLPEFEKVKDSIKMQLRQGKVVSRLMKDAKIELK